MDQIFQEERFQHRTDHPTLICKVLNSNILVSEGTELHMLTGILSHGLLAEINSQCFKFFNGKRSTLLSKFVLYVEN